MGADADIHDCIFFDNASCIVLDQLSTIFQLLNGFGPQHEFAHGFLAEFWQRAAVQQDKLLPIEANACSQPLLVFGFLDLLAHWPPFMLMRLGSTPSLR